jgi:YebC/PmpR family DNA-binding regulatory protein
MSGHSKWNTIKRKKAKTDTQKGKLFSRISREIIIAAKSGGPDPNHNSRLRFAIENAKEANMPTDNIKRSIQKGSGSLDGNALEESSYEGYGPAGTAIFVETVSDNRNRISSEIKHAFTRGGGNLGETGCVAWMFQKRGLINIERGKIDEEKIIDAAIDAGAEDIKSDIPNTLEIITLPENFERVRDALTARGNLPSLAEITMVPTTTIPINDIEDAKKILKLVSSLEDIEDVQAVHANFDIPDEIMEKISEQE